MKRYIVKGTVWFMALWVIFSFVDYHFAQTMYGGNVLTDWNIVVVMYKILDALLIGFIF